jgi:hypothetical protein
MSLCRLNVVKAAPDGVALYGDFVIDAPSTNEAQILDSLTEKDKGGICYHLGVTSAYPFTPAMPPYLAFTLYGIAPLALDYANRPATFTTENGYPVWINRREN